VTHYLRNCLIAGLLCSLGLPSLAESQITETEASILSITIRVYDYARVPAPIAKRAREETSRIFREAGITTEWASCRIPGQSIPEHSECQVTPLATDIHLNILPRNMARKMMNHYSEFGAAFPLPNSFGNRASIFYHRVDELAESQGASRALLLGHFMAHEIGHLLLGVNSHSETGLMHVPWDQAQRDKAYLGSLLFTEKEAQRIRSQTAARVQATQASR
jgi:hypothetical protein